MDYEKKYNEALERFKTFREKYCTYGELHFGDVIFDKTGEAQKDLDAIFPELADSEDERIRKEIIDYLGLVGKGKGDYAQPMIDRWIVYLEKMNDFHFDYPGLYFYDGKKLHFQGNPAMKENPYDFAMSQQEKQKEPHYTKRNALFDKCVANCDPEIMKEVSDEIDSQLNKEQKPDDNQFPPLDGLDAIKAQYYDRGFKNGFDEGVDLVKPAEWSEEDDKIRRNLMSLLANMRGNRITEETYQKYYPWLKDLRPSWKPSEEQMQYLLAVINDPNNAGAESCHLILESLYNDLKEL